MFFANKIDHSRLVVLSKRALLVLTCLLMLTVVVFSWMHKRGGGRLVLETSPTSTGAALKPVMVKPNYQGVDARNRPFNIVAENAIDEGNKLYKLNKVVANLAAGTADWVSINSAQASYYSVEERIILSGGVELTSDAGYLFTTPSATLMIRESNAQGNEVVEGTGSGGTLRANSFEILDGGDRIIFRGDVQATIYRKNAR